MSKLNYVITALLSFLILFGNAGIATAQNSRKVDGDVKAKVLKRMENGKRKVKVEMASGAKIKGSITAADADSFTLLITETNKTSVIAYRDVA